MTTSTFWINCSKILIQNGPPAGHAAEFHRSQATSALLERPNLIADIQLLGLLGVGELQPHRQTMQQLYISIERFVKAYWYYHAGTNILVLPWYFREVLPLQIYPDPM